MTDSLSTLSLVQERLPPAQAAQGNGLLRALPWSGPYSGGAVVVGAIVRRTGRDVASWAKATEPVFTLDELRRPRDRGALTIDE